ncbi:MAG TPA: hypothetical protein ENK43_01085 [Planctomycetes bacterium]|nr:hypothetical protein [Planctomycetota bacterium]
MSQAHISIIGRFDPEYAPHVATREAIIHAEKAWGTVLNTRWIIPDLMHDVEAAMEGTLGALIAPRNPKSPRQLWPEILGALTWLRERNLPTLALEYGYHHMLIEVARSLAGLPQANSSAYDEQTADPVITPLDHASQPIDKFHPELVDFEIRPDTALAKAYGAPGVQRESFRGHYALNPDYVSTFEENGALVSARGFLGGTTFPAAIELPDRAFHIGVAWLPQNRSRSGSPHPLVNAFVGAVLAHS